MGWPVAFQAAEAIFYVSAASLALVVLRIGVFRRPESFPAHGDPAKLAGSTGVR